MKPRHWGYTAAGAAALVAATAGIGDTGTLLTIAFLVLIAGIIHETQARD